MKIFTFSAEGVILEILQVVVSKKTKSFFLKSGESLQIIEIFTIF